jgi:hypothetical protein
MIPDVQTFNKLLNIKLDEMRSAVQTYRDYVDTPIFDLMSEFSKEDCQHAIAQIESFIEYGDRYAALIFKDASKFDPIKAELFIECMDFSIDPGSAKH